MHNIALQRLYSQRLLGSTFDTPEQMVKYMGAVQAQEYLPATWSLGLRTSDTATDAVVDLAFNEGRILRTHVMRPTWHFVTPKDIRWLLELTAPRIHALSAYYYRQFDLDDALFSRTNALIAKVLEGGQYLTRPEIGSMLTENGIVAEGVRLSYIMIRAELDAVVCSGPRRGKQFTYALLSERAPQALILPRDEALAELTRRYFIGHGPATPRDFVWWSGLTVADAKIGLEIVASHLNSVEIDDQTYWFSAAMPPVEPSQLTFLLPTFDEFIVGYADFDKNRLGGFEPENKKAYYSYSTLVIGDRIVGSWKRTLKRGTALVEIVPFSPLNNDDWELITDALHRYGTFHNLSVQIV